MPIIIGSTYGFLQTIVEVPNPGSETQRRHYCFCDCGGELLVSDQHLLDGSIDHCGCRANLRVDKIDASLRPERQIHGAMMRRCTNKEELSYHNYGGRGIGVSERWQSFDNFISDMGRRPSKSHSLDRLDNNRGYSGDNCRWATKTEQTNNTRANRFITHENVTKTLSQWARSAGLTPGKLHARLKKHSFHEAIQNQVQSTHGSVVRARKFHHDGLTLTALEWSERLGINRNNILHRLRRGDSVEQALFPKKGPKELVYTFRNESLTLAQWEAKTGIKKALLAQRLFYKWPLGEALGLEERQKGDGCRRKVTHLGITMTVREWSKKVGISEKKVFMRLFYDWPVAQALGLEKRTHIRKKRTRSPAEAEHFEKRSGSAPNAS